MRFQKNRVFGYACIAVMCICFGYLLGIKHAENNVYIDGTKMKHVTANGSAVPPNTVKKNTNTLIDAAGRTTAGTTTAGTTTAGTPTAGTTTEGTTTAGTTTAGTTTAGTTTAGTTTELAVGAKRKQQQKQQKQQYHHQHQWIQLKKPQQHLIQHHQWQRQHLLQQQKQQHGQQQEQKQQQQHQQQYQLQLHEQQSANISITGINGQIMTMCNVFDIEQDTRDSHECVKSKSTPAVYICIHPIEIDVHVSKSIKYDGIWEAHLMKVFQDLLVTDPELAVIDIGANIGQYSLVAAAMGRPVVAVEARLLHVQMIHHALCLNEMQNSDFVLLHNAVYNSHGKIPRCFV